MNNILLVFPLWMGMSTRLRSLVQAKLMQTKRKHTILVVDDELDVVQSVQGLLRQEQWLPRRSSQGHEVSARLRCSPLQ